MALDRGPQDHKRCEGLSDKTRDDLQFEASFFENIIAARPNYTEAKKWLAGIYTELGFYEAGLRLDQDICTSADAEAGDWYNLACSHALLGQLDDSLSALDRARKLGYDDDAHMASDPDLENIRNHPKFSELMGT